jgi:hypothetical protein
MNKRTVSTTITWHLELTPDEDFFFRNGLECAKSHSAYSPRTFFQRLIDLVPKGGEPDEKTSHSDDDCDLNFDDLLDLDEPTKPPVSMGQAPERHYTSYGRYGYATDADLNALAGKKANPQGDMANMRADLDASSTDANLRLAKLADICSGRQQNPVAESFDKFSHGPVEPKWDKPRW